MEERIYVFDNEAAFVSYTGNVVNDAHLPLRHLIGNSVTAALEWARARGVDVRRTTRIDADANGIKYSSSTL